jgi:hypothetical protein
MAEKDTLPQFFTGSTPLRFSSNTEFPSLNIKEEEVDELVRQNQEIFDKKAFERHQKTKEEFDEWYYNIHGKYPEKFNWQALLHVGRSVYKDKFDSSLYLTGSTGTGIPAGYQEQVLESIRKAKDRTELEEEFLNFIVNKEKKRVKKLNPPQLKRELAFGGILPGTRTQRGLEMFMSGFNEGLFFKSPDSLTDEIYGDSMKEEVSSWYGYGNMTGQLIQFMTLMKVATTAGIPLKLLQASKTSPALKTFLKILGTPKYKLGKAKSMFNLINKSTGIAKNSRFFSNLAVQSIKYATPQIAGAFGTTAGMVGALQNTIRNTVQKYIREDRLKKNEWEERLPAWQRGIKGFAGLTLSGFEGFFQKYFVGVINDPKNWPARFLGDAVYASGEQLYQLVRGTRKQWDWTNWANSFIQGHIMGEIQGIVFNPSLRQINTAKRKGRAWELGGELQRRVGYDFTDDERLYNGWILESAEYENIFRTGKAWNREELNTALSQMRVMSDNGGHELFLAKKYTKSFELKERDWNRTLRSNEDRVLDTLVDKYNLTPKEVLQIRDSGVITKGTLKDFEKILKDLGRIQAKEIIRREKVPEFVTKEEQREFVKKQYNKNINDIGDIELRELFDTWDNKLQKTDIINPRTKETIKIEDVLISKEDYQRRFVKKGVVEPEKPEPDPLKPKAEVKRQVDDIREEFEQEWLYNKGRYAGKNELGKIQNSLKKSGDRDAEDHTQEALEIFYKKLLDYDEGMANSVSKKNISSYIQKTAKFRFLADIQKEKSKKARSISDAYKEMEVDRIAKAKVDDWNIPIDINGDNRSPIYSVMRFYSEPKGNYRHAVSYFLQNYRGFTREEIVNIFNSVGLKTSLRTVDNWIEKFRKGFDNIVVTGKLGKSLPKVKIKRQYNKREVKTIYDDITKIKEEINPNTGLRKNIDSHTKMSFKKGSMVISFDDYFAIAQRYGRRVGKQFLRRGSTIMQDKLIEINKWFPPERNAKIYVVNPESHESTKFIFYQENLTTAEFRDAVSSIVKVLRENYDENVAFEKRFAIMIKKRGEKADLIANFNNIITTYTKNANPIALSEKNKAFAQLLNTLNPPLADRLGGFYFNVKNVKSINEIDKIIKLIPDTQENWAERFDKLSNNDKERVSELIDDVAKDMSLILDELSKDTTFSLIRNFVDQSQATDEAQKDISKKERAKDSIPEIKLETHINEIKPEDESINYALKGFGKLRETNLGKGIEGFLKSVRDHHLKSTTVLENKERNEAYIPLVQEIHRLGATSERLDINALNIIRDIHKNFNFRTIGKKPAEAYVYLMQLLYEREYKTIKDINPNKLEREEIQFKSKKDKIDLEFLKDNPKALLNDDLIRELYANVKSDQEPIFSKILVQHYGINPRTLIGIMGDIHTKVMTPVREIYEAGIPVEANYNIFAKERGKIEERLKDTLIKQLGRKITDPEAFRRFKDGINKVEFDKPENAKKIKEWIDRIDDPNWKAQSERAFEMYQKIDPERISYFTHVVLESGFNQKRFFGQVKDFIKKGFTRGEKTIESFMRDVTGRKFMTFESLFNAGYKVERDSMMVLQSVLRYMYEKEFNRNLSIQFKETFLNKFETAYRMAQETGDKDYITRAFEDISGYFYLPEVSEFKAINGDIKKLRQEITDHISERYTTFFKKRVKRSDVEDDFVKEKRERIRGLTQQKARLERLINIYKGEDDAIGWTKEDAKNAIRVLVAGERFLPTNKKSYYGRNTEDLESLYESITEKVGGIKASNLTTWDGIYFSRPMQKAFMNLVFKNDFLNNNHEYDYQRTIVKIYDTLNANLKQLRFYKPMIIASYDMIQGFIANPFYVKNVPYGIKASRHKQRYTPANNKKYETLISTGNKKDFADFINKNPAYFYRFMDENNLFNKSVNTGELFTNAMKASYEVTGKNKFFGGLVDEIVRTQGFHKRLYAGIKYGFKGLQTVTWTADEMIRNMVAKTMFDRFIKVHDIKKAGFLTSEWTNQFLVKYSRLPMHTRQWLNRIFLVPTYRLQTFRMYKEMIKMFGSGLTKSFNKNPELFKVSNNRVEQALFEMGPFLRTIGLGMGMKILLGQIFGYTYEDIFDLVTGYRLKKFKGRGILDAEMEFLSLGTPIYDLQKHFTRLSRSPKVWLRYQMAGTPGLIWSLVFNQNLITGRPMWTADDSPTALRQIGMNMLTMYTPVGSEYMNWGRQDIDFARKTMSFFGLGFAYNVENPQQMLRDFEDSIDRTKSPEEHRKLLEDFQKRFNRAYQVLMNEKFKTLEEELIEQRKRLERR